MDTIVYKLNAGDSLPGISKTIKIYSKLYKIPFIGRLFHKPLLSAWKFPKKVNIGKDFNCTSIMLNPSPGVSLADTFILAAAPVNIGSGTSFSFHNSIITTVHDYSDWSVVYGKPVTIGENCWITTNVTILPGVTIGDNTIIGAGSVVTRDIPSGVFAAGNPCRVIKKIDFKTSDCYKK